MIVFDLLKRFSFSSSNRHRGKSIRIMVGMMLSTLSLITTISIMNYLQVNRFAAIREVRSFDLVLKAKEGISLEDIEYKASFIYKEMPALLVKDNFSKAVMVRFIDSAYKGGLNEKSMDALKDGALVNSYYNSAFLEGANLVYLDEGKTVARRVKTEKLDVSGSFHTELGKEFDSNYIFLPLTLAPYYLGSNIVYLAYEPSLISELDEKGYDYITYKDAESSLYQAFLLEKWMMSLILSLLFLVMLVQIKTNSRLFIHSKRAEISILWTLGYSKKKCCFSMFLSGAFSSFIGCMSGFILSYPVLLAIPEILYFPYGNKIFPDFKITIILSLISVFVSGILYYRATEKLLTRSLEILYE